VGEEEEGTEEEEERPLSLDQNEERNAENPTNQKKKSKSTFSGDDTADTGRREQKERGEASIYKTQTQPGKEECRRRATGGKGKSSGKNGKFMRRGPPVACREAERGMEVKGTETFMIPVLC